MIEENDALITFLEDNPDMATEVKRIMLSTVQRSLDYLNDEQVRRYQSLLRDSKAA